MMITPTGKGYTLTHDGKMLLTGTLTQCIEAQHAHDPAMPQVVVAAFGPQHPLCYQGSVLLVTCRDGRGDGQPPLYWQYRGTLHKWLIPNVEYADQWRGRFVVDPTRHVYLGLFDANTDHGLTPA